MKTLILALTVAAFAIASAAQAGEKADKNKSTCSASAQTSCGAKATATTKSACCANAKQAKYRAPATARGTLLAQNLVASHRLVEVIEQERESQTDNERQDGIRD